MAAQPVVIDTDPGVDDCMALALALSSSQLDIVALTLVMGNHHDMNVLSTNACHMLEMAGKSGIPVYSGSTKPMVREYDGHSGILVHSENGIGNVEIKKPQRSSYVYSESRDHASEKIIEICKSRPGEITIMTLGPMTNLGRAIELCPLLPSLVKRVITMGGAVDRAGNKSPVAEANVHNDPEAARICISAPFPQFVLLPLDVTHKIHMTTSFREALKTLGPIGRFLFDITEHYVSLLEKWGNEREEIAIHDPTVVMYALHPEVFQSVKVVVDVETEGEITLGKTVADWKNHWNRPQEDKIEVVMNADQDMFKKLYLQYISKFAS